MTDLITRLRDADANSVQRCLGSRIFGEAADRIEALEAAIARQASAVRTLQKCEEAEINVLRAKAKEAHAAVKTLDSEREANAMLTERIEALEMALAHAARWFDLAKQPGDAGTDWLNERGWEVLDDVAGVVNAALPPSGGEAA